MVLIQLLIDHENKLYYRFDNELDALLSELELVTSWRTDTIQWLCKFEKDVFELLNVLKQYDLGGEVNTNVSVKRIKLIDEIVEEEKKKKSDHDSNVVVQTDLSKTEEILPVVKERKTSGLDLGLDGETIIDRISKLTQYKKKSSNCTDSNNTSSSLAYNEKNEFINLCRELLEKAEKTLRQLNCNADSGGNENVVETKRPCKRKIIHGNGPKQVDIPNHGIHSCYLALNNCFLAIESRLQQTNDFSVTLHEISVLQLVCKIGHWYQRSRNIFIGSSKSLSELNDLLKEGKGLQKETARFWKNWREKSCAYTDLQKSYLKMDKGEEEKEFSSVYDSFFYLLPLMKDEQGRVMEWEKEYSVMKNQPCSGKRFKLEAICLLVSKASLLYVESDHLKMCISQVRKAHAWMTKYCEMIRSATSSDCGIRKIELSSIQSLVDEDEELKIELEQVTALKHYLQMALDWEKRLKESGIERGTAKVSDLMLLLQEVTSGSFLIDMKQHVEVLEQATETYCICREPFEGFMIGCDGCNGWFHDECVGITKTQVALEEDYVCPCCSILALLKSTFLVVSEGYCRTFSLEERVADRKKTVSTLQRRLDQIETRMNDSQSFIVEATGRLVELEESRKVKGEEIMVDNEACTRECMNLERKTRESIHSKRIEVERCRSDLDTARKSLVQVNEKYEREESVMPQCQTWMKYAKFLIEDASFMQDETVLKKNGDIPIRLLELFEQANGRGISDVYEVRQMVRCCELIIWCICTVNLFQNHPEEEEIKAALASAANLSLGGGTKVLIPLENLLTRLVEWNEKVFKFIHEKRTSITAADMVIINEFKRDARRIPVKSRKKTMLLETLEKLGQGKLTVGNRRGPKPGSKQNPNKKMKVIKDSVDSNGAGKSIKTPKVKKRKKIENGIKVAKNSSAVAMSTKETSVKVKRPRGRPPKVKKVEVAPSTTTIVEDGEKLNDLNSSNSITDPQGSVKSETQVAL